MKKSIMIVAGFLYFTSLVTFANAQNVISPTKKAVSVEPLNVKFLGSENDYLVFRVEISTGNVNGSIFKIEDSVEGELYSNYFSTASKYQLLKIEKREGQILDFKLRSGKKVYVKTFTTDSNSKLYQKGLAVL